MNRTPARLARTLGAVLLGVAMATVPALSFAEHGFGGGGHGGGGGGHYGGGGHFGGGHFGGGHFGGGGHFAGGAHYAGGHFAAGHYGAYAGAHYAAAPHYAGGRGFTAGGRDFGRAGFAVRPGMVAHGPGFVGRPWAGGYWHGGYWPGCWFRPGFAWFLPVLPFGYATFWWGGVPFYYWDNLYYTWSPADNGYVATEPPPVAGTEGDAGGDEAPAQGAAPEYNGGGDAGDVYLYPRNGQSDQQLSNDRYECHTWAVGQTGFDPTHSGQQGGNSQDYRRAMIACLDARGYSAR